MSMAHDRLTDPRMARIMLMVGVVALVLLLSMDPAAAWPTADAGASGGGYGTVDWYSPSSDPL